jgi:polyisoprenoid-binding protein YceI
MKTNIVAVLIIITGVLALVTSANGQKLYYTKNGHVDFYSSTSMEDIQAKNEKVTSVINVTNGDLEFSILINAFQFEKALMQEHFNENYMESGKYPKSTFKGRITNLDKINFNADGSYPAEAEGDLTMHGVTKKITAKGMIIVKDGKFKVESEFMVQPEEFKIEVPSLVRNKIAREIKVTVRNNYEPLNK